MDPPAITFEADRNSLWNSIKYLYQSFVNILGNTDTDRRIAVTNEDFRSKILTFDKKQSCKKTVCAIFEKNEGKMMLIDALMKERISQFINRNFINVLISDGSTLDITVEEKLESIRFITRSEAMLEMLKTSVIVLCQKEYLQYFDVENKHRVPCPDLVVLVIHSPKELEQEDIQEFLSLMTKEYNHRNFILVLNNANPIDCTRFPVCEDCYPQPITEFINRIGLTIENQIFKVSSEYKFGHKKFGTGKADRHSNSIKDLQKFIEDSLCPNGLEVSYTKRVEEIKHSFEETRSKIETTISVMEDQARVTEVENNNNGNNKDEDELNERRTDHPSITELVFCRNNIDEGIKLCDEFLAIICLNRSKINCKEKIIKEVSKVKEKIEEILKRIEWVINYYKRRSIAPYYLGYYILNSIRTTDIKIDIVSFEAEMNSLLERATSDMIKEKLMGVQEQIKEVKQNVTLCEDNITIFLANLNTEEFYEREGFRMRFIPANVRSQYEEFKDDLQGQKDILSHNMFQLIAPFEFP